MRDSKPIVYIISAPSGSGKSTLVNVLLAMTPRLDFSISYTTRPVRGSEQNGKQYYFVSRQEFEQMIAADEFLEHASLYGRDYYGTARRFLREAGSGLDQLDAAEDRAGLVLPAAAGGEHLLQR